MAYSSGTLTPDPNDPWASLFTPLESTLASAGWNLVFGPRLLNSSNPTNYSRTYEAPASTHGSGGYLTLCYRVIEQTNSNTFYAYVHDYLDPARATTGNQAGTEVNYSSWGDTNQISLDASGRRDQPSTTWGPTSYCPRINARPQGDYEYWISATADRVVIAVRIASISSVLVAGRIAGFDTSVTTGFTNLYAAGSGSQTNQPSETRQPGVTAPVSSYLYFADPNQFLFASGQIEKAIASDKYLLQPVIFGYQHVAAMRGQAAGLLMVGHSDVLSIGDTITVGATTYVVLRDAGDAFGTYVGLAVDIAA